MNEVKYAEMRSPDLRILKLRRELTQLRRECIQEKTQHQKREEKFNNSMIQQRQLLANIIAIQEQERTSIAEEIQEELGQMLASLRVSASLISDEYRDHAQLVDRVMAMEQLIISAITAVQRISSELRPVMLDLLGLADAIEWKALKFQKRTGITCKTTLLLENNEIDSELSTVVYRIFQEALANVSLHSYATLVQVTLMERKGRLMLTVHDNGQVIVDEDSNKLQFLGIERIRGRAAAFGGKVKIFGVAQGGTALFARLPKSREEGHRADKNHNSR